MWKIFKSKKALSPVVAAIILIAVTVAVSIAVAAWMGALTFTFMSTEQLTYTNYQWGAADAWFFFTVKNTGSTDLTISDVRIDGNSPATLKYSTSTSAPYTWITNLPSTGLAVAKGTVASFNLTRTGSFTSGVGYSFTTITAKGNTFGPYTTQAP
jgi:flagellin-like protein